MADSSHIYLNYKHRLLPTKKQHAALRMLLEDQRVLYNAALEERISCYRKTGKSLSYMSQAKSLTIWRKEDEEAASHPVSLQRWTIKRLDDAFQAFFRRVKARDRRVGFPRFKGKGYWDSFGFLEFEGVRLIDKRLRIKGFPGGLKVHFHRSLPSVPLGCTISRDSKGWSVCFQVKVPIDQKKDIKTQIGLDAGLLHLATLSDGTIIPNPRIAKKAEAAMRRKQRALSRCKRGSKRRRKVKAEVTKLHSTIANTRSTYLHQVSADLVQSYDLIAIEKLNLKGLVQTNLAKSFNDAGLGKLRQLLIYKAEKAGGKVVEVDPKYTSQICPECGTVAKKDLSQRRHECACGCDMDRDHAAAVVILSRAMQGPVAHNVTGCGERVHRNQSQNRAKTKDLARV